MTLLGFAEEKAGKEEWRIGRVSGRDDLFEVAYGSGLGLDHAFDVVVKRSRGVATVGSVLWPVFEGEGFMMTGIFEILRVAISKKSSLRDLTIFSSHETVVRSYV